MLVIEDPNDCHWTWSGTDPDHWSIQEAPAANGPWTEVDNQAGGTRDSASLTGGLWCRVVGQDASNVDVTNPSNVEFEG